MSLWSRREIKFLGADPLVQRETGARGSGARITGDTAMRNSAVWAALRIRADLVSTFPVDVYRKSGGVRFEVPPPAFFDTPGGSKVDWCEWSYSSQIDLDRYGNTFGLITARDSLGLPARVDLWPAGMVTPMVKGGELAAFRYRGDTFDAFDVWHEKQYTVAGCHVGLSPVAYAAWTLGEYASIQQFALDWFGSGAVPSGTLKNSAKVIAPDLAREVKDQFKATVRSGDVFVHGNDWEYNMIKAEMETSNWLEAKSAGNVDVARFFGVPSDLIDAAISGQSITYANMSQRNLQFLIMNLDPALTRRENTFSRLLLARPRFMKFNRSSLLAMDPATQATMWKVQLDSRQRTPSEVRHLMDLPPFTPEQIAEFETIFGSPKAATPTNKIASAP